jgi:hypothetical protein
MRALLIALTAISLAQPALAQSNYATPYAFTSFVESAVTFDTGGNPTFLNSSAKLLGPLLAAADQAGNLYVAEQLNRTITKISSDGTATVIAGSAGLKGIADGTGSAARFHYITSITFDKASGSIFVVDGSNYEEVGARIRKITPSGVVTTVAGSVDPRRTPLDGTGAAAAFQFLRSLTTDGNGNLFAKDNDNYLANGALRKISSTGVVTTLVGRPIVPGLPPTPAGSMSKVTIFGIGGVIADRNGIFFIQEGSEIRKITASGEVSTIAGNNSYSGNNGIYDVTSDGVGSEVRFTNDRSFAGSPLIMALDPDGNIVAADSRTRLVRKFTPTGTFTTLAGGGSANFVTLSGLSFTPDRNGIGAKVRFDDITSVTVDGNGTIYVCEFRTSANQAIYTIRRGVLAPSGTPVALPTIASLPAFQNAPIGSSTTLSPSVTSTEPATYQWFKQGQPINGATSATFSFTPSNTELNYTTAYHLLVTNSTGSAVGQVWITVVAAVDRPTITTQPVTQTATAGTSTTLTAAVTSTAPATYQWLKNGAPLTGATSATLTLASPTAADAGTYSVVVTNSGGSVTSTAATLTVAAPNPGRLVNLSILTDLATPGDSFTLGTVIGGAGTNGTKPLLVRAVGPALGALGVGGTLSDPNLEFFNGSTKAGENDNWSGTPALSTAFTAVGAFPFSSPTSRDAALYNAAVPSGNNSIRISGLGDATGAVLAELYDSTPPAAYTLATPRLVNVSVLKQIGAGFTVGFVIGGDSAKTILVRAVGPGLAALGVTGFVPDPKLTLYSGPTATAENDNWAGTPALTAAFTSVGAFALPATSLDAALRTTLSPGSYSVQVAAIGSATGLVLVEVYEVP